MASLERGSEEARLAGNLKHPVSHVLVTAPESRRSRGGAGSGRGCCIGADWCKRGGRRSARHSRGGGVCGREGQRLGEEVRRGAKGRKAHVLSSRVSMLRSGGKGLPLKGSSEPGDCCRGEMEN